MNEGDLHIVEILFSLLSHSNKLCLTLSTIESDACNLHLISVLF